MVFDRVLDSKEMLDEKTKSFANTKKRLEDMGFEVNAWLAPTVGYGGKGSADNNAPGKYTRIVTDKGRVTEGAYCPLDENYSYVEFYSCTGKLFSNKFILDGEISPYSILLVTVYK